MLRGRRFGSPQEVLRRKRLVEFVDGGFDNLAGPLGHDAVTAGHVLQLATLLPRFLTVMVVNGKKTITQGNSRTFPPLF